MKLDNAPLRFCAPSIQLFLCVCVGVARVSDVATGTEVMHSKLGKLAESVDRVLRGLAVEEASRKSQDQAIAEKAEATRQSLLDEVCLLYAFPRLRCCRPTRECWFIGVHGERGKRDENRRVERSRLQPIEAFRTQPVANPYRRYRVPSFLLTEVFRELSGKWFSESIRHSISRAGGTISENRCAKKRSNAVWHRDDAVESTLQPLRSGTGQKCRFVASRLRATVHRSF